MENTAYNSSLMSMSLKPTFTVLEFSCFLLLGEQNETIGTRPTVCKFFAMSMLVGLKLVLVYMIVSVQIINLDDYMDAHWNISSIFHDFCLSPGLCLVSLCPNVCIKLSSEHSTMSDRRT